MDVEIERDWLPPSPQAQSVAYTATVSAIGATSLRRGLDILLALGTDEAGERGGIGVVQVARLVGREKSQVSRSLKTLAEYGFVDRDARTLGYRLGARLLMLATRAGEPRLLEAAPPLLTRLVARLGETAYLSVRQGTNVLTLSSESPEHAIRAAGWVGQATPAACTSAGRALLLDHERTALGTLFEGHELGGHGPNAPLTVDDLYERILADRARGYALVDEEFETGLVAAAAPVRGVQGEIVAALNVSAPKFRFGTRLAAAGSELREAAHELSAGLGRRETTPPSGGR